MIITAIAAVMVASATRIGTAQEVGARRGGTGITSPDVASDRRVTFRLRAPEAKAVIVSGDFGNDVEMRKGDDGIWSVTVGPLEPELYVYDFSVDGVRLTDPGNPQVKIGDVTSTTTSLLTEDKPAFYDVQDVVPHDRRPQAARSWASRWEVGRRDVSDWRTSRRSVASVS